MKILFLLLTSPFWLPVLLTILICALILIGAFVLGVLGLCVALLVIPLQMVYKVRARIMLAYEDLLKEVGSELKTIPWWRFSRMLWTRYRKIWSENLQ